MQRSRAFLLNAATVLASVVLTLLAIEGVLRFLPVAWAPPVQPPTAENPIQRYAANTPFTWSLGWNFYVVVHGRTNADGFVADYDYDPGGSTPLVAVVGDSYVEAMQVPFAQSLTGLLAQRLGSHGRVYAIAQAGAAASQYVAYARSACARFHPQRLVVNVVGNDFDESVAEHRQRDGLFNLYPQPDGRFDWRLTPLPGPGIVGRIARHSALALYLARNVGVSTALRRLGISQARAQTLPFVGNVDASASPQRVDEGRRVIAWFLDALAQDTCVAPDATVVVVDAPRPQIYEGPAALAAAHASYFGLMRAQLVGEARRRGFRVLDLEPIFLAAYASRPERFENPTDDHWNARGHAVVAAAVHDVLRDWAPFAKEDPAPQ